MSLLSAIISDDFTGQGEGMPQFRTIETEEYKVSISPVGIRRFARNLPYLYGSDVSFRFRFENKLDSQLDEFFYIWSLERWDNAGMSEQSYAREMNISIPSKGNISRIIHVGYLSLMGYYRLEMRFPSFEDTMASFTLMDRDLYMNRWQVGVIGGVIGAVVTLVAANLAGC